MVKCVFQADVGEPAPMELPATVTTVATLQEGPLTLPEEPTQNLPDVIRVGEPDQIQENLVVIFIIIILKSFISTNLDHTVTNI